MKKKSFSIMSYTYFLQKLTQALSADVSKSITVVILLIAYLAAFSHSQPTSDPEKIDAPVMDIQPPKTPLRIISTANYLTQIINALGKDNQIVGVDTTSIDPKNINKLPDIGYRRNLSLEGMLSLEPNFIVLADDSGPPAVITQLKQMHIAHSIIQSKPYEISTLIQAIQALGKSLNATEKSQILIQDLQKQQARLTQSTALKNTSMKAMWMMNSGGTGSKTFAGKDTIADAMMHLIGIHNVFRDHFTGYKAVNDEARATQTADVLFVGTTAKYGTLNQKYQRISADAFPNMPFMPACILEVDMSHFLTFGIYSFDAAKDLQNAIADCTQ